MFFNVSLETDLETFTEVIDRVIVVIDMA